MRILLLLTVYYAVAIKNVAIPPQYVASATQATKTFHIFLQQKGCIYFFDMRRDAFQAIADPTRREILGILAVRSLNINALTENFVVSRTAIYKHIKILTECGLIIIKQQGRERFCKAKMEKLQEVSSWVQQYSQRWDYQLNSLEHYISKLQRDKKKKSKGRKTGLAIKKGLAKSR